MTLTEHVDLLLEARMSSREQKLVGNMLVGMEMEEYGGNTERFYRWIERKTDEFLEELYARLEGNVREADRKRLTSLKAREYIALHNMALT